jgi:hypothetical protein
MRPGITAAAVLILLVGCSSPACDLDARRITALQVNRCAKADLQR